MRKETHNWWTHAKRDLTSAKNALKSEDYMVAFLCQQTVEKPLKALILHTKNEFYHHSLYLGKSVDIPDTFHSFLKLTPQYTISRYPNSGEIPSELYDEEIASDYVNKTEEVLQWIEKQLKLSENSLKE